MTIQGAKKWVQLGGDASGNILSGLINGSELPPRSRLVFVDVLPMTGNFFDGWLQVRQLANIATHYVACDTNPADQE